MTIKPDLFPDLEYQGSGPQITESLYSAFSCDSLYEAIDRNDCRIISEYMHTFSAPAGTELLREGEEGDFLLVIQSGRVIVQRHDILGKLKQIASIGAHSVIGEMSLIDGEHRMATCITQEPATFSVLTRANLNEILYQYPRLANKLLLWILKNTISHMRNMQFN